MQYNVVHVFRAVARFPGKCVGVNPGLSSPAILYAHQVYDTGAETSSKENVHRQIIESYASPFDGNRIDTE